MAICPLCHAEGEFCQECQKCHRYFVEARDLKKSGDDELIGDVIGGSYIPLALIGAGGMGKIYRAKNKYIGKIVALKVLKSEYMEDEVLKDRFFREAEVVSALDHPNIVKLYTCAPDEKHNNLFMAMELLTGRSLFDAFAKDIPDLRTMLRLFCQIASGLGEAHKHGIFHRDLKPENIFLCKDEAGEEHAKVLDFGFARLQGASKKLTMVGIAFGTPHYMSPEQAMGLDDITAACDVYALGVMLFQAVSGNVPFDSDTPMEVMRHQVYTDTPVCTPRAGYHAPKRLLSCIYKCMKKDPKDRFSDGHELYNELMEITKILETTAGEGERPTVVLKPIASPNMDPMASNQKGNLAGFGSLPRSVFVMIIVLLILILTAVLLFMMMI